MRPTPEYLTTLSENTRDYILGLENSLRCIAESSLLDFDSTIEWAQWCRNVATDALLE